jgi:hypothetical protein
MTLAYMISNPSDSATRLEQETGKTQRALDSLATSQRERMEGLQATLLPAVNEAIELRDEALLDLRSLFEDGIDGIMQELRTRQDVSAYEPYMLPKRNVH